MFEQDFLQRYKQDFKDYTELRAQKNEMNTLYYSQGVFSEPASVTRNRCGISARIWKCGGYGFSSLPKLDDSSIRQVLKEAEENADIIQRFTRNTRADIMQIDSGVMPIKSPFCYSTTQELQDIIDDMVLWFEHEHADAKIDSIAVTNHTSEKLLAISNGYDSHNLENYSQMQVSLSKRSGTDDLRIVQSEFFPHHMWGVLKSDMSPLHKFLDELYAELDRKTVVNKIEAIDAIGGECECVLSQQFTGLLAHEAVGHTMEADSVLREGSIGSKFLGKQVASPLVSLTDFANTAYGNALPVQVYVDDEGTPCQDAEIIKNGILSGVMTNRETAQALGVTPTGNARAAEFSDEPLIRMRNTCFLPGQSTLEEMISSIDRGYYLKTARGGNGSETGMFSIIVQEGYEIHNGKIGHPIRPTIVSGSAWEALKTVDMVSKNFRVDQKAGNCGKGTQTIPTISGGPEMKLRLRVGGK